MGRTGEGRTADAHRTLAGMPVSLHHIVVDTHDLPALARTLIGRVSPVPPAPTRTRR